MVYGCAILTAKKKTTGEIATEQGTAGKIDPAAGGMLEVCFPQGATAPRLILLLVRAHLAGSWRRRWTLRTRNSSDGRNFRRALAPRH